jgi:hypothetical protein
MKDGKMVRTLTNQEYNTYELKPGEEYDFGEFRDAEKFQKESRPIQPMIDKVKFLLNHAPSSRVIMLTARADFNDKETVLATFKKYGIDMSRVHIYRAGNLPGDESPAQKKAVYVRQFLSTGKYGSVSLYDDSMSNLQAFKGLKKEFPGVTFAAHHVTSKGTTTTVENMKENFADGKGPGRPGDSQRHGIPKHATMSQLQKASHAKGRKGQLARWQINMRRGKKK